MSDDPLAWLQAQDRVGTAADNPARWAVLEGLARRAAQQQGPLRELLFGRLRQRLAAWQSQPAPAALERLALRPGPLATLRAEAGQAPPELRAISQHRGTWTRLSLERRLSQSCAATPARLGPLHAEALLPRALQAMRALSPDYLQHFLAHVDALAMLPPPPASEAAEGGRRSKVRPAASADASGARRTAPRATSRR
jgi:hypothetical protein